MAEYLTISEVARLTHVRPSAIRYYESIQLLPIPQRVSGQRRYERTIVERLAFIGVAQKLGFSLAEIQLLFGESQPEPIQGPAQGQKPLPQRWQALARQKLIEVEAVLEQARHVKQLLEQGMRCGCPDLDDCIDCVLNTCS